LARVPALQDTQEGSSTRSSSVGVFTTLYDKLAANHLAVIEFELSASGYVPTTAHGQSGQLLT
jgi:hypothetical protein